MGLSNMLIWVQFATSKVVLKRRNNMQENPVINVYCKNVSRYHTCWKFDSCFRFQWKDKKVIKVNLKVKNYRYDYFHIRISFKFLFKSFLHNTYSLITWNTKSGTKKLEERPQQTLSNYVHISWKTLLLRWLFFESFRISWFIWQRFFDHFCVLLIWVFNYFCVRAV